MLVDHVHRGYKHSHHVDGGFECDECRWLSTLEHKRYRLREANGVADTNVKDKHQIEQLRDRVKILLRRGYTLLVIAEHTGITDLQLRKICRPGKFPSSVRKSTLTRFTAFWDAAQLDQGPAPAPRKDRVDAELSRAAVQGLQLRGWPGAWIAEQIGLATRSVNAIARGEAKAVHHETQAKLVKLAREYGTTDGPSPWTRARAVKQGWESTAMRDELL